jgi:hypothetical protein
LTSKDFSVNEKKPTQSWVSKFDTLKKPRNQDEDKTDPKTSEGRLACSRIHPQTGKNDRKDGHRFTDLAAKRSTVIFARTTIGFAECANRP